MYQPFFSETFRRELEKLTKKDSVLKKRIATAIEDMKLDPYAGSIELKYDLKGKRRTKVGDYRLIYGICEECRKNGHTQINRCYDCNTIEDNTVKFFDVFHRSEGYDNL